jgi:hypothetical protein
MMDVREMAAMGRAARDEKYDFAHRIAWEMRGGPKRKQNASYSFMEVMTTSRKKFDKLCARTRKVGIPDRDVFLAVVWANKEFTELRDISLIRQTDTPDSDDLAMLARAWQEKRAIPIGYVGGIFSRKTKSYATFARPLVVDNPAVAPLLQRALDEVQLPSGGLK